MGKLGARELNYSSDIDLIVLYDPEAIRTDAPDSLQTNIVRLTRNMVRLMDERTADGYVFRTDLRLRPDPAATPLAISVLAAETYYESLGQNWERAAMIKARPVAGDKVVGVAFLDMLRPFVWRKNLDFAAIQDIHSIKRQINAHRGGTEIAVNGHNLKLGRGGIREIEFFAQTQQLIWGGRQPALRCAATGEALRALCAGGQITSDAAEDLMEVYRFLRRIEHRLQMINDEQTHTLPQDSDGLASLAVFLGYSDADAFAADVVTHLRRTEAHYVELFEDAPSLGAPGLGPGNLVFTGSEPDPDTLETIERLGFRNPATVDAAFRRWHHGRYRATRSTRARELLTELAPVLLEALSQTPDPDAAFVKFDEFLSRLPAGVQLFSNFFANPNLLGLVAEIVGGAPRLAEHLSRRPLVLDSVLTEDFFDPPPPPEVLEAELDAMFAHGEHLEDILDISRRWANDRWFQVGVQNLRGHLGPRPVARALSNIADTAVSRLYPFVEEQFAGQHGGFPGSGMIIVAMGTLGAREMTPASDLDLIFIYSTGDAADASDGPRPLAPSQYFARLSQRLINAITAQTAEGKLYDVDMRLRPSGRAGPIASSFESFVQYHDEAAWTWEHMALTRARVIAGPADLRDAVEGVIRDVLTRPRDPDALLADIADMRARMDREHHTDVIWDLKHLRGGLVDIEFITQYLQLRHAHADSRVLSPNTRLALLAIRGAGLHAAAAVDSLIEALDLWQAVHGMLRLTLAGDLRRVMQSEVPEGLRKALARAADTPDFGTLQDKIRTTAERVYGHFTDLIDTPAKALAAAGREPDEST
jgi:glutamate-ammonia-ligase adenylyltransferase